MPNSSRQRRVKQVTDALLGFQPGDRVVFVDGGESFLTIEDRLGQHGKLVGKDGPGWSVRFDGLRITLFVREQNLVREEFYDKDKAG